MAKKSLTGPAVVSSKPSVITQYFSKWRNEWIDFKNQPAPEGEIIAMRKYHYELR